MKPLRLALLAVGASLPLAAWAFWWEPASFTVTETPLDVAGWTGPPLRIALLTDLHVGSPWMSVAHVEEIVAATNAAQPNLVLLLGDYCINGVVAGDPVPLADWTRALGRLEAPLGTFAVLGNHDWWNDGEAVMAALEAEGVPVLENAAVDLGDLWVVGIGDQTTGHDDAVRGLVDVPEGAPIVALTHNPDLFDTLDGRVALLVAGHSHGGQVDLPFLGAPVVPSRYVRGHYRIGGHDLFVSSGLGTSILPVRFRVPPEVVILQLEDGRRRVAGP